MVGHPLRPGASSRCLEAIIAKTKASSLLVFLCRLILRAYESGAYFVHWIKIAEKLLQYLSLLISQAAEI